MTMKEQNANIPDYAAQSIEVSSEAEWNVTDAPEEGAFGSKSVPFETFIGLVLAFSSCFFIGISVIFKKLALRDIEKKGSKRAVDGGFGYLRMPKWWLGITLMGLGELTNFVAYIFAPAILVTPLGVFSIVCTATLSPYFLKESLNSIGKLGCILVVVGCVIVTLCGPKDREISTVEELHEQLLHPGFLIYSSVAIVISVILMALVPRFGYKYVMLYITICSCFGSLSVMFCKGVGLAIKQTIGGHEEFNNWSTWVCIISLIVCLLIETIYMQRALDLFNSSIFMSVNYVMFTSMVIIASSILYTEFSDIGWKNIFLTILGFIVNIAALYILHLAKTQTCSEEDPKNDICQENDHETPLMIKNNAKLNNIEAIRASPLSNISLSPSLFKDIKSNGKLLNIFKIDPTLENLQNCDDEPRLSLCSQSSEDLYNIKSSASNNSIIYSPNEHLCSENNYPSNENAREILYEIPLLKKLQKSSRTDSFTSSRIPSLNSPQEEGQNDCNNHLRPTHERFFDTNKIKIVQNI